MHVKNLTKISNYSINNLTIKHNFKKFKQIKKKKNRLRLGINKIFTKYIDITGVHKKIHVYIYIYTYRPKLITQDN